jgi:hypothetical protein
MKAVAVGLFVAATSLYFVYSTQGMITLVSYVAAGSLFLVA